MTNFKLDLGFNIGFIGLTHLGLVYSTAFAACETNTVCYSEDKNLISQLNQHILPVNEPDLLTIIKNNQNYQVFSNNITDLLNCKIIFFAPDIMTDDNGVSDLSQLNQYISIVLPKLNNNHIVVFMSQLPPRFCRQLTRDFSDLNIFYQVETLVFGKAIERALHPERIIVGSKDKNQQLPIEYQAVLNKFNCPVLHMDFESAELTKIAINICLVSTITTANTLAEICENLGANWADITSALRLDKRIGEHAYLKPGLGIAGGNLERDLRTIVNLAREYNTDSGIVQACINNSKYRVNWILKVLNQYVFNTYNPKIAILGLAYKENTHSIKNSPALKLIDNLIALHKPFVVHDPVVKSISNHEKYSALKYLDNLNLELSDYEVIIITTPWEDYKNLDLVKFENKVKFIIDPYQLLNLSKIDKLNFNYFTLGQTAQLIKT